MSHKITNRQKTIVNQFTYEKEYKIGDIQLFHDLENISLATLKRDLSILTKSGYILLSGESRSSSYGLSSKGLIHRDIQNSPVYQNTTMNTPRCRASRYHMEQALLVHVPEQGSEVFTVNFLGSETKVSSLLFLSLYIVNKTFITHQIIIEYSVSKH